VKDGVAHRLCRPCTLALGLGAAALAVLGLGIAVGARLAPSGSSVIGVTAGTTPQPTGRALIEHVGELSGRLLRLESEAARLGERVGVEGKAAPATVAAQAAEVPSGGPWVAAGGPGDITATLDQFAGHLDRIEALMDRVAELTHQVEFLNSRGARAAPQVAATE